MNTPADVSRWCKPIQATLLRLDLPLLRLPLILAVVWQESTGNAWAYNPEPPYHYLWDNRLHKPFRKLTDTENASEVPPADFHTLNDAIVPRDAEWWAQQASWGLMQLMGAAAREQHFRGLFLTELLDPYINLEYGIKHLWNYAYQFGNRSTVDALLRWNGGGDPEYANKIITKETAIEADMKARE